MEGVEQSGPPIGRQRSGRERARDPLFLVGIAVTALLHFGIAGGLWIHRIHGADKPLLAPSIFMDAQLVKFGKPRDLSFLPHKEGPHKIVGPAVGIKVAKSIDAKVTPKKQERPPDVIDPLKKTHAEAFKKMADSDQSATADETGGSLSGSRAGTATEARGDPYILALIDAIGSSWTVPTTIKDSVLAGLSADVCLTIDGDGTLVRYSFTRPSGNSQFDSSLEATLGTTHRLPPPPARFASAASRGRLCPTFSKQ